MALCSTEKIECLAGDKGYDDGSLHDPLHIEDVRRVGEYELCTHYDQTPTTYGWITIYTGQCLTAGNAFSAI